MQKFFDYVFIRLLIFITSFFCYSFVAPKVYLAIIYALVTTLAISILIDIFRKKTGKSKITFSSFLQHCILGGGGYVLPLVAKLLNLNNFEIKDNILTSTVAEKKVLIINTLKFGNISPDEIIRLYNIAKQSEAKELYILARLLDRRSMAIANSFQDIKYIVISARRLYQMSTKARLLTKEKIPRIKSNLKASDIFKIIISRNLAPKYLLTAIILAFMTLFTPLKTYYVVMTSIALILTILSFSGISSAIAPTKLGIFGRNIPKNETNSKDDSPESK